VLPVGVALGQQFGLQFSNVAVFGVHHRDATEFGQPAERAYNSSSFTINAPL
jgi:hypothetical protein